jgi:hypothetical protein
MGFQVATEVRLMSLQKTVLLRPEDQPAEKADRGNARGQTA